MEHPLVKILADQGCQAYLVACPRTRRALVVDPKVGRRSAVREALLRHGLRLVGVVDTHTHADHLSDALAYDREGVPVYMGRATRCRRRVVRLGEGDEIRVGELRLRVLEVPGHTDDSIALAGDGFVLTGDTLLVGSLARADFRGSDPARLFASVREKLLPLPDDTVVLPGHGYNDILFSTIGVEKAKNPHLRFDDPEAYAEWVGAVEGAGNTPDVDRTLALNLAENPDLPEEAAPAAACCAHGGPAGDDAPRPREAAPRDLAPERERLAREGRWIDVRDAWEFAAERIPGTRNVPLGEIGFHLDDLPKDPASVFSCLGGVRSLTAARTLMYLGAVEDPISMAGGLRAWKEAGLPVEGGEGA